jgi:NAD(P) transhydrogenase subunit alpha
VLVTEDMVTAMQPGGIIVDLAAEQGGNCACTIPGQEVVHHGISILGPQNMPSLMPLPASQMYARNIMAFLSHIVKDKAVCLDSWDDITQGACVTHAGDIVPARVRQAVQQARAEEGR